MGRMNAPTDENVARLMHEQVAALAGGDKMTAPPAEWMREVARKFCEEHGLTTRLENQLVGFLATQAQSDDVRQASQTTTERTVDEMSELTESAVREIAAARFAHIFEILSLCADWLALRAELAVIESAAHMPADYQHGLSSWINQHLYAEHIGAKVPQAITDMVEAGTLTFPNAPELLALRAELAQARAELDAARTALEDIRLRSKRIREKKAIVGVEASYIEQIAHAALETPGVNS